MSNTIGYNLGKRDTLYNKTQIHLEWTERVIEYWLSQKLIYSHNGDELHYNFGLLIISLLCFFIYNKWFPEYF